MSINNINSWLSLLKGKLYCNLELYVYLKDDKNIPDIQPRIDVEYEIISNPNELEKYYDNKNIKKNKVKLQYFLKHRCKLYLLLYNGDVAGFSSICKLSNFKPYLYNNHPLFQGKNKYYHFFGHVFEKYRGNRLHPSMNARVLKDTIKKNEKVFATTPTKNIIAQKGIKRAGYLELGVLRYKRIGFITLISTFKNFLREEMKN